MFEDFETTPGLQGHKTLFSAAYSIHYANLTITPHVPISLTTNTVVNYL